MKNYKIEFRFHEPNVATALFAGENPEETKEKFIEYAIGHGAKDVEILEITEIDDQEAANLRQMYAGQTNGTGTIQ